MLAKFKTIAICMTVYFACLAHVQILKFYWSTNLKTSVSARGINWYVCLKIDLLYVYISLPVILLVSDHTKFTTYVVM